MQNEHQIVAQVYAAKKDNQKADELISQYIPFIKAETSRFIARPCTEQDDEFSIGMIAFHEAILNYVKGRGAFLPFASMLIKNRLIDHQRKEARHQGHISIYAQNDEDDLPLHDQLADDRDHFSNSDNLDATRQEIEELQNVMVDFGISLSDVADNSPRQERTLNACRKAVQYATEHPELLDELLQTKKLPMAKLVSGTGAERKTLERHRRYILAMLLIQTNGYEIIRGHIRHVLKEKGGVQI